MHNDKKLSDELFEKAKASAAAAFARGLAAAPMRDDEPLADLHELAVPKNKVDDDLFAQYADEFECAGRRAAMARARNGKPTLKAPPSRESSADQYLVWVVCWT